MALSNNIIQDKSYSFAIEIIKLVKVLQINKEYILSKQLIRSGTSIGALVEEAIGAQTRKDFYSKITIAYKEARETKYWLRLLTDSGYLDQNKGDNLKVEVEQILRILGKIQISTKASLESDK